MPKLAMGSWSFVLGPYEQHPLDLHTVLHALEDVGLTGLELGTTAPHPTPESHASAEKRIQLLRELADHGLSLVTLRPDVRGLTLVNPTDASPYLDAFDHHLNFASALGVRTLLVDTVAPLGQGKTWEAVVGQIATVFAECARRAAIEGVTVAWEFAPGLALDAPSAIAALVEEVAARSSNFGVLFDTCNASLCAQIEGLAGGELELLDRLKGKIVHVHLADSDGMGRHVPPGQGRLRWETLLPALKKATPCEWWGIDLGDWPEAFDAIAASHRFLTRIMKKQLPEESPVAPA